MKTDVKKGQTWRSLRTGKNATVNEVKDFGGKLGMAAQVQKESGHLTWLTIGLKGITGYRLVGDLE